jgi:hypothetical protein
VAKGRTDYTVAKRRTDYTVTKRRTDYTVAKRRRTGYTIDKRRRTDYTVAKRTNNNLHRKLVIEQHEPQLKSGSELLYSGRVSSSISGTCRATIVTNPMISHE